MNLTALDTKHCDCIILILHVYNRLMMYIDLKTFIFGNNHMSINVAF